MDREKMLAELEQQTEWDFVVVGGGATGLGIAIEAASRGYRILLLEQSDFAKGTSSRSTKLVHGGVRYLQQGNVSLVLEALKERGIMRRNAPHLVHDLPFVVPYYDWWEGPFYGVGLKIYDILAGRHGFGASKRLSIEETLEYIPTVETKGLRGGIVYHDGQFDDARLAVNLAQTAVEQGATVLNYVKVEAFEKEEGLIRGVVARDQENGTVHACRAKVVINAAGVFADAVRRLDDPETFPMIAVSQGVHIVLDRSFLPGEGAVMVPHTTDGRVLFATPWRGRVIVGTTDTPMSGTSLEPRPLETEIDFLLSHAAKYLTKDPERKDILSMFAGLRPLVREGDDKDTAAISRDHTLHIGSSGLVTITGGKWTTYRKMAEDTVDHAAVLGHLEDRPSVTRDLHIHGYHEDAGSFGDLEVFGADASLIEAFCNRKAEYSEPLHPDFPEKCGLVAWTVANEMARTIEDFFARRTRLLLLDARASMEMAPKVAALMAGALSRGKAWQEEQVAAYRELARQYLP